MLNSLLYCMMFYIPVLAQKTGRMIVSGYPENAMCAMTNAARYDPNAFAKLYKSRVSCDGSKGELGPVYMYEPLVRAAAAHADDMVKNGCFAHETCSKQLCAAYGSCDTFARIRNFVGQSSGLAENIAAGQTFGDPVAVTSGWLESPGHCANLLNAGYDHVGFSLRSGSTDQYGVKVAQNFARLTKAPGYPLVCGGHNPKRNGVDFYMSVSNYGGSVDTVKGFVDGNEVPMKKVLGNSQGSLFQGEATLSGAGCFQYYFEAYVKGNKVDRYPDEGSAILLNGVSGCKDKGLVRDSFGTKKTLKPPQPPRESPATQLAPVRNNIQPPTPPPQSQSAGNTVQPPAPQPASANSNVQLPATEPELANSNVQLPAPQPASANSNVQLPAPQPASANSNVQLPAPQPASANSNVKLPATQPELADSNVQSPAPQPELADSDIQQLVHPADKNVELEASQLPTGTNTQQNPLEVIAVIDPNGQTQRQVVAVIDPNIGRKSIPSPTAPYMLPNATSAIYKEDGNYVFRQMEVKQQKSSTVFYAIFTPLIVISLLAIAIGIIFIRRFTAKDRNQRSDSEMAER